MQRVHVGGTARPQLVNAVTNPSFYAILSAFHRRTGIPSLLNTSFNIHKEPIVCTPVDAVATFLAGDLAGAGRRFGQPLGRPAWHQSA